MAEWEITLARPDLSDYAGAITKIERMAVNSAARRGRAWFADAIMREVNFPSGYLSPSGNRFSVSRLASVSSLQAELTGRDRPTSLARFALNLSNKYNPAVAVHRGAYKRIKGAFLIKLRNGNMGLAVRAPIGEKPRGAWLPKPLMNGLWLLYAPSVDQVFKEQLIRKNPVYERVFDFLENEFDRLFSLWQSGSLNVR